MESLSLTGRFSVIEEVAVGSSLVSNPLTFVTLHTEQLLQLDTFLRERFVALA